MFVEQQEFHAAALQKESKNVSQKKREKYMPSSTEKPNIPIYILLVVKSNSNIKKIVFITK